MKKGSKARHRFRILAIGTTICLSTVIAGCSLPGTPAKPNTDQPVINTTKVETQEIKPGSISITVSGSGYLVPARTTTAYYESIYGTLKKFWVKENDQIKVGQPIAEIQTSDLGKQVIDKEDEMKRWPIKMNQMNEELARTNANVKLARINLVKARKEKKDEITLAQLQLQYEIAQSSYKNGKWNADIARLDYKNDLKELTELKGKLKQSVLKSKVNGVVVSVENLSENELVNTGHVMARIAEYNNIVFRITTAQAEYINGIRKAALTINNITYQVSVYSPQPGDQLDIKSYSESGTEIKNYIFLRFQKNVPPFGMNELTNASLVIEKSNIIALPSEVVYQEAGKNFVDIKTGNDIKPIEVVCGLKSENKIEIISGLKVGQKIVLR